jgi:hypothetical protein
VVVVGDCNYVRKFKGKNETLQHVTSIVNKASHIYRRDLNVTVAIADGIFKENCGDELDEAWNANCSPTFSMNNVLPKFQKWVEARKKNDTAYHNLFTACRYVL